MTKKSLILVFLLILLVGFVVGYIVMSLDIKDGILGSRDGRSIWQIFSPF